MPLEVAKWIPWLPALAAVLCGICAMRRDWKAYAGIFCFLGVAGAFALSFNAAYGSYRVKAFLVDTETSQGRVDRNHRILGFNWINTGWKTIELESTEKQGREDEAAQILKKEHQALRPARVLTDPQSGETVGVQSPRFSANFSFFIDNLTVVMLMVVTGVGALVVIYAMGYMDHDEGFARFFAFVGLFIFAMTTLVMADNLILLYLGWEGVGLCSYLLIGFYYKKPAAIAAAKKAFIVNRIGDLGFALGIFLIYQTYGTVVISDIIQMAHARLEANHGHAVASTADLWIPFLLMLGAFGKSAQLPLYVWLPDAMEGPTPVSALIHAATMVTAGVYMIARLIVLFELSPAALPTVATVGALTALFAGTIAMCQNDIKRVFAYSTISQLGYMFLGVGAVGTAGAVFHLFTHAFFKALLFLTAGSVMHACAGQLDMKKMSGLRNRMPQTATLMFIGCLALAGVFPFAGFWSKESIIHDVFAQAAASDGGVHWGWFALGLSSIVTAGLTAYYTFRLWFRVFGGPEAFEMGHDGHGDHSHGPHEMPGLMNGPLVVLAIGSLFAGYFLGPWVKEMVGGSTAGLAHGHHGDGHHAAILEMFLGYMGGIPNLAIVSTVVAATGIFLAYHFHLSNRPAAARMERKWRGLVRVLANKYYVDEINDAVLVRPLRMLGSIFFIIDRLVIEALVGLIGRVPRFASVLARMYGGSKDPAAWATPEPYPRSETDLDRGQLQGYGFATLIGLALLGLGLLLMAS